MKKLVALMVAVVAFSCALAEKQPFERYQTIIDRMPFGQPPPGFDPTRDPNDVSKDEYSQQEVELTLEQEAIQKAVRFSVINVESDGVVHVGFSDMTDPKAPRHFYLAVGETRSGWSVKDADPNEKKMTVAKDGVEVELALGENSGGIDGKAVKNARNTTKPQRSQLLSRGGDAGGPPMSMRGRREKREAEEAARRAEDAKQAAERERERAEREKREEEERAAREAERAEQREQLNALKEELLRQREEARAARERGEASDDDEDEDSEDE